MGGANETPYQPHAKRAPNYPLQLLQIHSTRGLCAFLHEQKPHVICLNEIKLNQATKKRANYRAALQQAHDTNQFVAYDSQQWQT